MFIIVVFKFCFKASHPVRDLKAFPKDNMLWVEWTAPSEPANKYVLEWCVLSDTSPCVPDWQQEAGTVHRTHLTGTLAGVRSSSSDSYMFLSASQAW